MSISGCIRFRKEGYLSLGERGQGNRQYIGQFQPERMSREADLQKFIDSVWLHPQSPPGFRDQVGTGLASYGLENVKICQFPWDSLP